MQSFFPMVMFTFETNSHGVPRIMQIVFKLAVTPLSLSHTHPPRMHISESEDIIGKTNVNN